MQIPLPLIIAGIVLVIIVIWKYFDGDTLVKRKPVIKEQSTTTSSTAPTAKKKGFEFKFGTLIGWVAMLGVAYICYLTVTSVVKEMTKPRVITATEMLKKPIPGTPDYIVYPGDPNSPIGWAGPFEQHLGETLRCKTLNPADKLWVKRGANGTPVLVDKVMPTTHSLEPYFFKSGEKDEVIVRISYE